MAGAIRVEVEGHGPVEVPAGATFRDVLAGAALPAAADVLAVATADGRTLDLSAAATAAGAARVRFVTFDDEAGLDVFRHSSAHLMAQAVTGLFPNAKPTIGPVVEEGFYYDFGADPFTPEDLERIEARMAEIVTQDLAVERIELTRDEALGLFADNPFKVEMIRDLPEGSISAYRQGGFIDLCRGPHVPRTGVLRAFKLTKVAGAYWRADARNAQLQRIYGISFPDAARLADHLRRLEEARERDHRRIGQEMELFSFHDEGQGFPFWHPKGMVLRNAVVEYWREAHRRYGYQEIQTPIILNEALWHTSGHWDHYRRNMYFTSIDDVPHAVKPMNCPGGLLVYKNRLHSYREFPLKVAELGLVHRHELSGVLHGLFRVRAFTQDDAHIFCTPEQVRAVVEETIGFMFEIYGTFGFRDVAVELSTRPLVGTIGSDENWANAEAGLEGALRAKAVEFKLNPGDGAFYGPKIDFHIRDCMGRSWQCGTIQVDFSMPDRFRATYEAEDGTRKVPVMIHRAMLGSLERFIGILIEHHAGRFPLWLNPTGVKVLPVADKFADYARHVAATLAAAGIRAEADLRNEKLGRKVRDAQLAHVNYQLVVGGREAEAGTVAVRTRAGEDKGALPLAEVVARLKEEIAGKE
ncbi:MAG: threonine--tRNA ligase [Deltaproteobacteria bacterium]|nr:threonine--tRNA ligase [Deltaproteobacteria bacterium]